MIAERRTVFRHSAALVGAILAVFLAIDAYIGVGASGAALTADSAVAVLKSQYWPASMTVEHVLGAASAVIGLFCAARAIARGLTAVNNHEDPENVHGAGAVASMLLSPQLIHFVVPTFALLSFNPAVTKSLASWLGMVSYSRATVQSVGCL